MPDGFVNKKYVSTSGDGFSWTVSVSSSVSSSPVLTTSAPGSGASSTFASSSPSKTSALSSWGGDSSAPNANTGPDKPEKTEFD